METHSTHKKSSHKKQIRDINRLLAKTQPNDEKRKYLEKRLDELNMIVFVSENREKYMKNHKSNKTPSFKEKMKLFRTRDKVSKQLKEETDETKKQEYEKQLQQIEEDINYCTHFPDTDKYIPLFPSKPLSDWQKQTQKCIQSYIRQVIPLSAELDDQQLIEDVAYRKSVLPTMLSVLKELREKSEFIPTESEKESENAEEHNEEANPIAEDDFFME
ncbi:hypothetical protein WA538_005561, partial [Blastocystis sp. DL]